MAERELTNYDKYLLKKMEAKKADDFFSEDNSGYSNYIISQLRRTTPSDSKVMTKEEYLRSENVSSSVGTGKVAQAKNGTNLKKMGFAFLILYVIIVLALALIVMVNAKRGVVIPGADASAIDGDVIQVMPLEEAETESHDWFDEICDSLNK